MSEEVMLRLNPTKATLALRHRSLPEVRMILRFVTSTILRFREGILDEDSDEWVEVADYLGIREEVVGVFEAFEVRESSAQEEVT